MASIAPETKSMTLFDWQARLIERSAGVLAHWLGTTQPDKRDWCPCLEGDAKGRSASDQVRECIVVNQMFASVLRGDGVPQGWSEEQGPSFSSVEEAQEQLKASAAQLADAVRGMKEEDLQRTFETAFAPLPGAVCMELPMANMHYHAGQINYVQLLYGDAKFDIPPGFATF
jgi:hypothetical protein